VSSLSRPWATKPLCFVLLLNWRKLSRGLINARHYTLPLSVANFVGSVVGFLNVCKIRLRSLLLAASLSFDSESVSVILQIEPKYFWRNQHDCSSRRKINRIF
jgi:hypothetical protein